MKIKEKVLMIGQFPPMVTGEASANIQVENLLRNNGVNVRKVNSCIVNNVNEVGELNTRKIFLAMMVLVKCIFYTLSCRVLYITPGQTFFGVCRFIPVILFARLFKRKIITHWHGYGIYHEIKKRPYLKKIYFNKYTISILLTHDLKAKLKDINVNISNVEVVQNFVDLSDDNCYLSFNDPLKVLYLGGLMREKGIINFVEAAKLLPNCDLIVCGSGDDKVEELLKTEDRNGHLCFRGPVSGESKHNVFLESDIFVLQSSHPTEGVPLTILEAMSYQCAVITTMHNGIPETVGDVGLYIDSTTGELVKKINMLINDKNKLREIQAKSRKRAELFSIETFQNKISNIIIDA
jgi:glycosyltransferase involved in cell wall biosynthesis